MRIQRKRRRVVLGARQPEPPLEPVEQPPVGARAPGVRQRHVHVRPKPDLSGRIRQRIEAARPFVRGGTVWR